jgi:hypothetical protein
MLLRKNENAKLLILIAVILTGVLFWGILYFNKSQERDLPTTNNETQMPQKSENNKQEPVNKTDKAVNSENNKQEPVNKTDKAVNNDTSDSATGSGKTVQGNIVVLPPIDYKNLKNNEELKQLMVSRKKKFGFKESLDMIVNSDETFKIGDVQIPMRDILEKAAIKEGKVFQEKIEASGAVQPQKIKKFGIYVVQPGDNIWNIHFNILKEFYDHQGIKISPVADEPSARGMSSGVGKILKFSETMVIIYNFIEKKIDSNIDLLEPLSKIIAYNMDEVFSLLQEVNYDNIDRIQFDGKSIWIPTKKI